MRLFLAFALFAPSLIAQTESPLDATLRLALRAGPEEIQKSLFEFTKQQGAAAGVDPVRVITYARSRLEEANGHLTESREGTRLFRIDFAAPDAPVLELHLIENVTEGPNALLRFELREKTNVWVKIAVRLRIEDNIWKVVGVTSVRPAEYTGDWNKPQIEDVRLTDPVWFHTLSAENRESEVIGMRYRVKSLQTALSMYQLDYGKFPESLQQLLPPADGSKPDAKRADAIELKAWKWQSGNQATDGIYTITYARDGDGYNLKAAPPPPATPDEPALPVFEVDKDGNFTDSDQPFDPTQLDPLRAAMSVGQPKKASASELRTWLAIVNSQLKSDVYQALISLDLKKARQAAAEDLDRAYLQYGLEHPGLAVRFITLGGLSMQLGDAHQAQQMIAKGLALLDVPDISPTERSQLRAAIANYYVQNGDYGRAREILEAFAEEMEDQWEEASKKQLDRARFPVQSILGLAELYMRLEQPHKAEQLVYRYIRRLDRNEQRAQVGLLELVQFDALIAMGLYGAAGKVMEDLQPAGDGMESDVDARQAVLLTYQGHFEEADRLFRAAHQRTTDIFGEDSPAAFAQLLRQTRAWVAAGDSPHAEPALTQLLDSAQRRLGVNFAFMNEEERLRLTEQAGSLYDLIFSYGLRNRMARPEVAGLLYNAVLQRKGLVGATVQVLENRARSSPDPATRTLFASWVQARARAAAAATNPDAKALADLSRQAAEIESKLAELDSNLGLGTTKTPLWQDVRKALQPGQAAVEFIRFRPFAGSSRAPARYLALVLTPTRQYPLLLDLGDASGIEGQPFQSWVDSVQTRGLLSMEGRETLSDAIWQPIEQNTPGVRTYLVAPDGPLQTTNFDLLHSSSGKLLLETTDVRVLTSTRHVIHTEAAPSTNPPLLIGDPDFSGAGRHTGQDAGAELRSRDTRGGPLKTLPGARKEIDAIRALFPAARVLVGGDASEQAVKAADRPAFLHIATHGFFLPTPRESAEDPMLRSGLYLAGADLTLAGQSLPGAEDGVLTAYEASTLSLEGTQLVVLSACDTGLGATDSGEGIFGLRRAMQVAGARAVLSSLWSVPDRETAEIMTFFYSEFAQGTPPREALRKAETRMRALVQTRYGRDLPFYWAAFLLVE